MALASALVFDHCMSDDHFPLQLFRQAYTDPDLKSELEQTATPTNFGGFKHLRRKNSYQGVKFTPGNSQANSQATSKVTTPRGNAGHGGDLGQSAHYSGRLATPTIAEDRILNRNQLAPPKRWS